MDYVKDQNYHSAREKIAMRQFGKTIWDSVQI